MKKKMKIKSLDEKTSKIIVIVLIAAIICASCVAGGLVIYKIRRGDDTPEAVSNVTAGEEQGSEFSAEALDAILNQQMMYVNGINYYYQNSSDQLIHDAIGASVYNNSTVSIKSFVIAFCAFDLDGNPIKIVQPDEQGEGGYVRTINYDFTAAQGDKGFLAPGETCKDVLMYVNNEPQIVTVKACVKSYVSTDEVIWENSYYQAFMDMYYGKSLNSQSEQPTSPAGETTMPNTDYTEPSTAPYPDPNTTTTVPNTAPSAPAPAPSATTTQQFTD